MSNSIGRGKAMVPFTLSDEDKKELGRLAFLSDKSSADYVRQLVLPAIRSGLVFLNKNMEKAGCLMLLVVVLASFFGGSQLPRRSGVRSPVRTVRGARRRDEDGGFDFLS